MYVYVCTVYYTKPVQLFSSLPAFSIAPALGAAPSEWRVSRSDSRTWSLLLSKRFSGDCKEWPLVCMYVCMHVCMYVYFNEWRSNKVLV